MYGKLINDTLVLAPDKLPGDGVVVYNPPAEMYLAQGWLPVVYTNPPGEPPAGYQYVSGWEENDLAIVQTWEPVLLPDDITDEELVNILFGEDFAL